MFSLNGKVALVTGGGSGIGAAIAHALSDAGAEIILVGRRRALLEESLGARLGAAIPLDLMADGAVDVLKGQLDAESLTPDILLNCAGYNPRLHADAVSPAEWAATLHLNLTVPFQLAQALVGPMKARGWGRIINIASLQSDRAFPNGIAYGASKGGVTQLTRAMAEAWSTHGITANAIAPGFFPTELTAAVFDDPERAARNAAQTCIGRNGRMEDLAGPAVFLASDASGYVTGQVLNVDGGFTAK
jgi:NAD(P)-dependent dehydrogenase (short-subunit alcohol dehydrogenase family)